MVDDSTPAAALLSTRDLRRSFGSREVIASLDLAVPTGKVYGFLGRNGSGKTTTIRMLLGILRPDCGTITYDGQQVPQTTAAMKARIGYVSQQQHFYEWMRVRRLGRFVGRGRRSAYGRDWRQCGSRGHGWERG